jgi:hypothetical protein
LAGGGNFSSHTSYRESHVFVFSSFFQWTLFSQNPALATVVVVAVPDAVVVVDAVVAVVVVVVVVVVVLNVLQRFQLECVQNVFDCVSK